MRKVAAVSLCLFVFFISLAFISRRQRQRMGQNKDMKRRGDVYHFTALFRLYDEKFHLN